MDLLNCENLSFSYETKTVIKNLSFPVKEADYLCILGENGVGKTTLLKGLLGLKKKVSGQIKFSESLSKKDFAYLAQYNSVQNDFPASVLEVVLSGFASSKNKFFTFYTKKEKQIAIENLKELSSEDLLNKSFMELSGGQKQRVLLARALCANKKILILDEPSSNLDVNITKDFFSLLKKINSEKNITIIMVLHDVKEALKNAKNILHLGKEKYFYGSLESYLESDFYKSFRGQEND